MPPRHQTHGSFVPPKPVLQLRDLTRTRTAITRERGRGIQRLEKLLEDAGIHLRQLEQQVPTLANSTLRRRISTLSSWSTQLDDE